MDNRKPAAELEGAELDWWVAKAEGLDVSHIEDGKVWLFLTELRTASVKQSPRFSTVWSDGGPIVERERIGVSPAVFTDRGWIAGMVADDCARLVSGRGPTPLIAAMRVFVESKFGESVLPREVRP